MEWVVAKEDGAVDTEGQGLAGDVPDSVQIDDVPDSIENDDVPDPIQNDDAQCDGELLPLPGLGPVLKGSVRHDVPDSTQKDGFVFGRKIATAKIEDADGGKTYIGQVKCTGAVFGFIECPLVKEEFGDDVDVFVPGKAILGMSVGDEVKFGIQLSAKGQPQAINVRRGSAGAEAFRTALLAPRPVPIARNAGQPRLLVPTNPPAAGGAAGRPRLLVPENPPATGRSAQVGARPKAYAAAAPGGFGSATRTNMMMGKGGKGGCGGGGYSGGGGNAAFSAAMAMARDAVNSSHASSSRASPYGGGGGGDGRDSVFQAAMAMVMHTMTS